MVKVQLILLFCLISTGLYAQSFSTEQLLIGTWIFEQSLTSDFVEFELLINSNGTLFVKIDDENLVGSWAINANKIVFIFTGEYNFLSMIPYEYYITSNGDKMVLITSDLNLIDYGFFSGIYRKR